MEKQPERQAKPAQPGSFASLVTIILRPHLEFRGKPKWDAVLYGNVIVVGSTHPVRESTIKLITEMGYNPDQLVTFKHEHNDYGSFKADTIINYANQSIDNEIKRVEAQDKALKSHAQGPQRRIKGFRLPNYFNNAHVSLRSLHQARELVNALGALA